MKCFRKTNWIICSHLIVNDHAPWWDENNFISTLWWRHNERDDVSSHQPHDCLLNRLFRRRSKKTSKLRVTDLCEGNSPLTGEFPAQMPSNAENVSIWWRHHGIPCRKNTTKQNNKLRRLFRQIGVAIKTVTVSNDKWAVIILGKVMYP